MRFGSVAGIDRDVSQMVLGTMGFNQGNRDLAFRILDAYVDAGGNCLDTAWIYAGGASEQTVGEWIASRGLRDELVLTAKGACTTECTPDLIAKELEESLDRLQTGAADIYLMHRDNPSVPVGEFVDLLNRLVQAGRMKAIGGSNWSTERIAAANEYAASNGLVGFTVSSPNLSLAQWNEPPWEGTTSASDRASRDWYERNDVALFAWSSQAGGFFTGRYSEASVHDPAAAEMVRVWFNEGNFARYRRAEVLAERLGVAAVHVALAYVLCQPFQCFALIGPLTVEELDSSLRGARLELSPAQLEYLAAG
jgi:aryl-alcohol dehydrogenase-like predicted oxidoreductase